MSLSWNVVGYDRWGYPEYEWGFDDRVAHDWDMYERAICQKDEREKEDMFVWLHDGNRAFYVASEIDAITETPYAPKPSRNIRFEKTRDYRKRRPKAQRYNPESAVIAGTLFCLFGGFAS